VTGRTDEQPSDLLAVTFQHGMETVFIAAQRADLQLIFECNEVDIIVHGVFLAEFLKFQIVRP
jgi:hypothetical protein